MNILVTGGLGYIGSHTSVELLDAGHTIVVIDNLYNSKLEVADRIKEITQKDFAFYQGDLCDKEFVRRVFQAHSIDAVIHFAAYKAVGESVSKPLLYYHNNLLSTITLCEVMQEFNCKKLVFSSSATVYGNPASVPIREDFPRSATNPYGSTKLMIEQILTDVHVSDPSWSIALLRYFNPIGAHKSGLIGENPNDIPNNLMPYIAKVATGELPVLHIYGNDYATKDGTGVRDYIHVVDLSIGHLLALDKIMKQSGVEAYNLGTGNGYSVLELHHTFEEATKQVIPYQIDERRPGDIPICYADPAKAQKELGFQAQFGVEEMCKDTWHFIQAEQKR